jgi:uncharacterized protein (TIGR03083 family)
VRWQVLDSQPVEVLDVLHDERRALLEFLTTLGEADWHRPTDCPGWSVRDIGAHLLHDDLRLLAHLRDGYRGVWFDGPASDLGPWLHERNQGFVAGTVDLSPTLIVDLLDWTGTRLDSLYGERDPSAIEDDVAWAVPDGPCPNWLGTGREYTERLAHQNQIRRSAGAPELGGERWLGPALDIWRWCLPVAFHSVRGSIGITAVDPDRTWYLTDGGFVDTVTAPNATVTIAAAAIAAVWTAAPNASLGGNAIGDPALLAALGRSRSIIV